MDESAKVAAILHDRRKAIWQRVVHPLVSEEVIAEHEAGPFLDHSPQLDMVLAFLRNDPLDDRDRLVVIVRTPEREWAIGELARRRGSPVKVRAKAYSSLGEVEHAIFLERLKAVDATFGDDSLPGGM